MPRSSRAWRRHARPSPWGARSSPTRANPSPAFPTVLRQNLLATSYTITAEIDVLQGGAEGVILTDGGRFGGYGLYLLKGRPVFTWNLIGLKMARWEGPDVLTPGKHTLEYDFKYDGLGF